MPPPGFRVRPTLRSCHACRLRKVRCIYPEGQEKICERCRDAGVQCIAAAKNTRKSNWRRSVDEVIAHRADGSPPGLSQVEREDKPLLTSLRDLPSYIKPLPAHLSASAITYLQESQALAIPDDGIRDKILESYFEFFHPTTPLINPREFADSLAGNSGGISLLLLQAMLFIACSYLDLSALRELGVSTNKEARKVFFDRARLLHEFDCEEDPYISAQALLMLSNWFEPTERKETSYWLGCAFSAIQLLPQSNFMASIANRRLWWAIYARDRSLTWSTRRPLRLSGNYDVEELSIEDFCNESDSRFLKNPEDRQENALSCIQSIKLHTTICNLILSSPGLRGRPADAFEDNLPLSTIALFIQLLKWPLQLPNSLHYPPSTEVPLSRCLTVQLSMMHIVYWSTIIEISGRLPPDLELPAQITPENIKFSTELANHAMRVVQGIFQLLRDKNYVSYLPQGGAVALCRCIVPLIRQLESLPSLNSFTLSRRLVDLMDAFCCFRSTYTIAEHIFKVFCLGLRQAILRDTSQILFLDQTDWYGWETSDSSSDIDKLYNNIRLLLMRLDNQDSNDNLPITNSSSDASGSASIQSPDSIQQQIISPVSSTTATTVAASLPEVLLSEFQWQSSDQMPDLNGPDFECEPMEFVFDDTRDLMSAEEFDEFYNQFGLTGAEWG